MTKELVPQLPPEALALLDDPRTAGLRYVGAGFPNSRCVLAPAELPAAGESRFLIVSMNLDADTTFIDNVAWENMPQQVLSLSREGLESLGSERPRFVTKERKPDVVPQVWVALGAMVVSPAVADVLRKYDPAAINTVAIDWICAGGERIEGYAFIDVPRIVQAYDWQRSSVRVEHSETGKFIAGLGMNRALRRDLDPAMHLFRDAFALEEVFVSRELAGALQHAGSPEIDFLDPATF